MTSPVSTFIRAFDPAKKSHVTWLKKMTDLAETLGDPSRHQTLVAEINNNPLGVQLDHRDALMWVEIHFGIAMKYTKAVLNSQAVVPFSGTVDQDTARDISQAH
jgi:ribosomal protein L6P/L9E